MNTNRKITVGIPTTCLHETHPRGVIRAARAIVERLVAQPGLHCLAIAEPTFASGELICESQELGAWLESHPLRREEHHRDETPLRRAVDVGRRVLTAVGLKRPGKFAFNLARNAMRGTKPTVGTSTRKPQEFQSFRDIDVILSFECYDSIWQWPIENYGCKSIGVFHDAIPLRMDEGHAWRPEEYHRAAGLMALRANVICCDSRSTRTDLESFFPVARGKARVVHLGHDVERFRPQHPRPEHRGKRIAMIGDIEARKNQAGLLRACREIAAAFPNDTVTLVLIGRPRTPDPVEFLVAEAGQYVQIERTGYAEDDELPLLLQTADCFVYPSLWEGFGIPVLEAMSAGVPVVCSESSSLPEVAGSHAFYCDPHEPSSIAKAVIRALSLNINERAVRTKQASEWAARFTWDATAARFHDVLTGISINQHRETA